MESVDQIECLNNERLVISFRRDSADQAVSDDPYPELSFSIQHSHRDQLNSYLQKLKETLRSIRSLVVSDLSLLQKMTQIQQILQISPNLIYPPGSIRSSRSIGDDNNPTLQRRYLPIQNTSNNSGHSVQEIQQLHPFGWISQERQRVSREQGASQSEKEQMAASYNREIDRLTQILKETVEQYDQLIEKSKQEKRQFENQIKGLEEEAIILREDVTLYRKDNVENEQLINQFKQQIKEKNEQVLLLQSEVIALKAQIVSQQQLGASARQRLQKATHQLSGCKRYLALLSQSNQQLTSQNHKLTQQAERMGRCQADYQEELVRLIKEIDGQKLGNEVLKKKCEDLLKKQHLMNQQASAVSKTTQYRAKELETVRQLVLSLKEQAERLQQSNRELKQNEHEQRLTHQSLQAEWNNKMKILQLMLSRNQLVIKDLEENAGLKQKQLQQITQQLSDYKQKRNCQQEVLRNRLAELEMEAGVFRQQKDKISNTFNKLGLNIASFLESSTQSQIIDSLRKKLKMILLQKERAEREKSFDKFFMTLREYRSKFRPEELQRLRTQIAFILSS